MQRPRAERANVRGASRRVPARTVNGARGGILRAWLAEWAAFAATYAFGLCLLLSCGSCHIPRMSQFAFVRCSA